MEHALGPAVAARLLSCGLLLDCATPWGLVASPIQVYPLSISGDEEEDAPTHLSNGTAACCDGDQGEGGSEGEGGGNGQASTSDGTELRDGNGAGDVLLATDFDCECLVPPKWAVMPIGDDSIDLVRLAPHLMRDTVGRLLDLCVAPHPDQTSATHSRAPNLDCTAVLMQPWRRSSRQVHG